jgi:hypothetical protein
MLHYLLTYMVSSERLDFRSSEYKMLHRKTKHERQLSTPASGVNDSKIPLKKSPRKNYRILPHSVFLPSKLLRATYALFKAVTKPSKNQ